MKKIKVGSAAPAFSLKDKDGKAHSLAGVKTKYTVVFFYPKDDTPGCTIEAKEVSSTLSAFANAGVTVFGISGGDDRSKAKFCEKYDLKVTLLSDPDFSVAKAYESYGEKKFMGRAYLGIMRNTFLIDASKKIVQIFDGVKPEGHAAELLEAVASLGGGSGKKAQKKSVDRAVAKPVASKASGAKKVAKKTVAKKVVTKKVAKKVGKKKAATKK